MPPYINDLLGVSSYLPHGVCLSWSPLLVMTNVISDILIFMSYASMPIAIVYFSRRRPDFPYRWLLWMFAAFILACGTTHLMGAVVLWVPLYGLDALFKAITAAVSVLTAIALWPLLPHALRLPSPSDLRRTNLELQREITERKRIEDDLRHAKALTENALYRERMLKAAIVESSEDAIMSMTLDGVITSWNPGAERMFGFTAAEAVDQKLAILSPCETQHVEDKILANVASGERAEQFEAERRHKDGHLINVSATISPIRDNDGRVIGISKVAKDITERKSSEAKIKNALDDAQRFREALNTVPAYIYMKDRFKRYVYANKLTLERFNCTEQDLIGSDDTRFFSPQTVQKLWDIDDRVLAGNRTAEELDATDCNGIRTIYWEVKAPILGDAPERSVLGIIGVSTDISQSKQNIEELEQYRLHLEDMVEERTAALSIAKESAEAANRAKNTFLANMSHELRTPMNGILGMTDMAIRRATDPSQKDHLDRARQSAMKLMTVINEILDISKIEAERLTLEQTAFNLAGVLDHVDSLARGNATGRGLIFAIEIDPDLRSRPLLGDPYRLTQILINLTGNAIRFTDHGTVTVCAHLKEETPSDLLLRFDVKDTGIGIPADSHQRIFTAFEQADNSTTRKFGGTGLGLAICRRLVSMMGGDIGVVSQVGDGSTFWFTIRLPKADEIAAPLPPVDVQKLVGRLTEHHHGARILLAEDEPVSQLVAQEWLNDAGLTVDVANTGTQAVSLVGQNDYDLILMDMQMPEMDGLVATGAIRRLPRGRDVPILALTANAFAEDRDKCLTAGMNDFISKPVEREALYTILLRWLDRELV